MSWQTAIRVAHIAATQGFRDLEVDPSTFPVPIDRAIDNADIELVRKPMTKGFGFLLEAPSGQRGIIVNSGLSRSARRQTEAHELGHHRLAHPIDPDNLCSVDPTGGPASIRATGWTPNEKAAEAFAAWFLMPPKAVQAALAALGTKAPQGPEHVYQLSLLLGTSYRATVRHLVALRYINYATNVTWGKVPPATLKRKLLPEGLPSTREVDVWQVDRLVDDAKIHIAEDDLLLVGAPAKVLELAPGLTRVAELSNDSRTCIAANISGNGSIRLEAKAGSAHQTTISLQVVIERRPLGSYRPDQAKFEQNGE